MSDVWVKIKKSELGEAAVLAESVDAWVENGWEKVEEITLQEAKLLREKIFSDARDAIEEEAKEVDAVANTAATAPASVASTSSVRSNQGVSSSEQNS